MSTGLAERGRQRSYPGHAVTEVMKQALGARDTLTAKAPRADRQGAKG